MSDMSGPNRQAPIEIDTVSAQASTVGTQSTIRTFGSYSFERSILTPASAFRFTAPGVDSALRLSIRSGDLAALYVVDEEGFKHPIGTGIIDETDTHITPTSVEYVLTGRDVLSQLVDNAAVDANSQVIVIQSARLETILRELIKNTRIVSYSTQQVPNGSLLFQTNPGETKINSLQRYLEFANCLIWTGPDGGVILGRPNFSAPTSGQLVLSSSYPFGNNLNEARVRRNTNNAIRKIVTQLQTLNLVNAGQYTINNDDKDMKQIVGSKGGRSVYNTFSYGQGNDTINQLQFVGNQSGNYQNIGANLSLREIARDNMKIIDVEAVTNGHMNENGVPYNIDQIYDVHIEDEGVSEEMYVYSCSYELTIDHGMITRMHLCRKGTIVAGAAVTR